jgi:hypothetical protein
MQHDCASNAPLMRYFRMLLYYETVRLIFYYFSFTVPYWKCAQRRRRQSNKCEHWTWLQRWNDLASQIMGCWVLRTTSLSFDCTCWLGGAVFMTMRNFKDTSIFCRVTVGEQYKPSTGKYAGYFLPLFKTIFIIKHNRIFLYFLM